jgi:hypothetical protein
MKISEITAKEKCYTPNEIELLKVEVELFLNKKAASQTEILSERTNLLFPPAVLEIFFRKEERNEKISRILQYLLTFLVHIPEAAESENQPLNPIAPFLEGVLYEVDLLLEEDVNKAVFNEINQMGSLDGDNVWDYLGRIIEKNRELNELLITGTSDAASSFFTMCLVLENLCLFWFDVKQGDMRRIRRSDVYLYKLARILQDRCRQTPES